MLVLLDGLFFSDFTEAGARVGGDILLVSRASGQHQADAQCADDFDEVLRGEGFHNVLNDCGFIVHGVHWKIAVSNRFLNNLPPAPLRLNSVRG